MSTNTEDESFHPLGSEWESELEDMLDETEYDTDLGFAMAEDAQRLVAGELSEAEFHEKYHEAVLEEFDVDDRPTAQALEELEGQEGSGGFLDALAGIGGGDGEESRRNVMKKMGAGAAFLGLSALATAENGDPSEGAFASAAEDDDDGIQWGMTIDLEICDGCLSCVQACSGENNLDQGVNWMYVLSYDDSTVESPEVGEEDHRHDFNQLVRPCQHCTDAPCEKVCPTTARHTRSKDGLVLTDYDVCIGCRYCQVACPYGVNYFQWGEPEVDRSEVDDNHWYDERGRPVDSRAPRGVMSKCTMCPSRQDGNMGEDMIGTTACMDACPPGAIQFGDRNDSSSDPRIYEDHPSVGRALEGSVENAPDAEEVAEALDDEDDPDLEDVEDAVEDLDVDTIAIIRATVTITEKYDVETETSRSRAFGPVIGNARDIIDVLEDAGIDFEDEDVLDELGLAGTSEQNAEQYLDAQLGTPVSSFKLLEDIGTNPNVAYLGNQPGPKAEQVPGPVAYEDVELTDNRKDVLDEKTVDGGLSL